MTAAAIAGLTGNKTTVVFATSGLTLEVIEIDEAKVSRGQIDDSDLDSTDYMEYLPEDLADTPERTFKVKWVGTADVPDIHEEPELITVTHAMLSGGSTQATFTGTAFATEITVDPEHKNKTRKTGTLKVKYDGKTTKPTFTPAT